LTSKFIVVGIFAVKTIVQNLNMFYIECSCSWCI